MTIEIKVPDLPESVADATIATWHKKPGDLVARCLLYTSPSPRNRTRSRMPSSA